MDNIKHKYDFLFKIRRFKGYEPVWKDFYYTVWDKVCTRKEFFDMVYAEVEKRKLELEIPEEEYIFWDIDIVSEDGKRSHIWC